MAKESLLAETDFRASLEGRPIVVVDTSEPNELRELIQWAEAIPCRLHIGPLAGPQQMSPGKRCPVLMIVEWRAHAGAGAAIEQLATHHDRETILLIVSRSQPINCQGLSLHETGDIVWRPAAPGELTWRADRAIRRIMSPSPSNSLPPGEPIRCGPLTFDPAVASVLVGARSLDLRRTERAILEHLMRHSPRPVATPELQREVLRTTGDGGAVRTQVYEIRRKLAAAGLIDAIRHWRGKGYRLRWPRGEAGDA